MNERSISTAARQACCWLSGALALTALGACAADGGVRALGAEAAAPGPVPVGILEQAWTGWQSEQPAPRSWTGEWAEGEQVELGYGVEVEVVAVRGDELTIAVSGVIPTDGDGFCTTERFDLAPGDAASFGSCTLDAGADYVITNGT